MVSNFLNIINSETLGRKVSISLNQKKQGHIDKAMLNITEANRDQVVAIREIQNVLDDLENREKTDVIFEKYRQIFPFQIGLKNGEEVLNILTQIKFIFADDYVKIIRELYNNEDEVNLLIEELLFVEERMKGKITENELDALRNNIFILHDKIYSKKNNYR